MSVLTGAIIGGIVGLLVAVITAVTKEQRFKSLLKTISAPHEYAALYHYATFKRYKKSFKFFDSYGVLYLVGNTLYYKTKPNEEPLSFNLTECTVAMEPDWRWLKWFSVTPPSGEKFYFNAHKMGFLQNNSEETLKGYKLIKLKTITAA